MFKCVTAFLFLSFVSAVSAQDNRDSLPHTELAHIKAEYVDVLALEGTAKAEVLAIARLLRARPEMAIDRIVTPPSFSRLVSTRSAYLGSRLSVAWCLANGTSFPPV